MRYCVKVIIHLFDATAVHGFLTLVFYICKMYCLLLHRKRKGWNIINRELKKIQGCCFKLIKSKTLIVKLSKKKQVLFI